jgi:methionyl-tRNA formyltransferase
MRRVASQRADPGEATRGVVSAVAVTQSDPFFTGPFFASFLDELEAQPVKLVEIVVLPNFNESRAALALRLLRLYGIVDFARLAGRYLTARLSDRRGSPRTVEAIAARKGIRIRRLASINRREYIDELRGRQVDVLLSVSAPEIFGQELLAAAPFVLNVHSGKLPEYRGMMPTFWALLNGEQEIVVTVHEMASRVDAGAVVAEYPVAVRPAESAFDLAARAKHVAGREVARLLGRLRTDSWPQPRPLPEDGGGYYSFPRRADARSLRGRGRRLL